MKLYACTGCGRLSLSPEVTVDDDTPDELLPGHHVIPDDPERDWICHGRSVEDASANAADIVKLAMTNGLGALERYQPGRVQLEALGELDLERREANAEEAAKEAAAEADASAAKG